MNVGPFDNQVMGPAGQATFIDAHRLYLITRFVASIFGVKVRWPMIIVIHIDCYAKKLTDTRHSSFRASAKLSLRRSSLVLPLASKRDRLGSWSPQDLVGILP